MFSRIKRIADEKLPNNSSDESQEENVEMDDDRETDVVDEREDDISTQNNSLEDMVMGDNNQSIPTPTNVNTKPLEVQVEQIAKKGRDVLKIIEEYKFFVDQMANNMKNNEALAKMVDQKKVDLDQASQKIYDVVYEMENMDVLSYYQNPLMGIDNVVDDEMNFSTPETTDNNDSVEENEVGGNNSEQNVSSPNDLLDMMGEDEFKELMDEDLPADDEVIEEEEFDVENILPKQPTVKPQGNPTPKK